MATQKFKTETTLYGTLELDDTVIDRVDEEQRNRFYRLLTKQQVAAHIAYNMSHGARLSQLDGWADMDDSLAIYRG